VDSQVKTVKGGDGEFTPCAKVKKETARHDLTDVLRGSLASSLLKSFLDE